MAQSLAAQISRLSEIPISELQRKYEELFDGRPCRSKHRQFLVRRIAWRMQEQAYGGLTDSAKRRLDELISEGDPINTLRSNAPSRSQGRRERRKRDRRLPIPGTVLTRKYRGRTLQVTVLGKGFEFEGRTYRSLTAIARKVTGAHWNGFLFFNLA